MSGSAGIGACEAASRRLSPYPSQSGGPMQRHHVIPLLATAAAAFLGCETLSTPPGGLAVAAQGKGAVQQQIPYADTIQDCDSQALALSGTLHVASRVQQDGQGRYHAML